MGVIALLLPVGINAQQTESGKTRDKKDSQQIIITTNGDSTDKLVIEVIGEKVLINGKPADDNTDVRVTRNRYKDLAALTYSPSRFSATSANRAMLGVTSSTSEDGAEVLSITKKSAAEKAGLKKGDVISKIDEVSIETPDDLSKAIREHKPGDKVTVTYSRDKKSNKVTAELGKTETMTVTGFGGVNDNFNFDTENFGTRGFGGLGGNQIYGQLLNNAPRLGLLIQDTEDGKGVKLLNVDDEGNAAKAGLKEDDIVTEVDGKAVNSADEMSKIMRESKDKVSVKFKYERAGKSNTVDVKIPRKLKTANL